MSGSPTEAELLAMSQAFLAIRGGARTWLDGTLLGLLDTLEQAAEGDFMVSAIASYAAAVRAAGSAILEADPIFLDGFLRENGKRIGSPSSGIDSLMRDLYDSWVATSDTLASRTITYATPSAGGGNTGTGLVSRLTKDDQNFDTEACTIEAKVLLCTADQITGARRGEEVFRLDGVEPPIDALGRTSAGSGVRESLVVRHGGTGAGGSLLTNSNFDETHDTDDTLVTKVPGWEITTGATNLEESSTIFVEAPGVLTADSQSLQFEGNAAIRQKLTNVPIDVFRPYFLRVMVRRQSSCDGTLTLALGSHSVALDVTTHTNDTWEELLLTVGTNLWPLNWYEDEADVSLALTSNTTGNLLVDSLILCAWDQVDGTFWVVRAGATPFKLNDTFTMTDSGGAPTTAEMQYAFVVNQYGYLPSTTGVETWPDS